MITSSELRIGNILGRTYYNPHPENPSWEIEPCFVAGIQKNHLQISGSLNEKRLLKTGYEGIKPIPITKEWMVKFGMLDIQWCYMFGEYSPYGLIDLELGGYGFVLLKDGFYLHKIEYVHQLQNLYFALKGTELEIKQQ